MESFDEKELLHKIKNGAFCYYWDLWLKYEKILLYNCLRWMNYSVHDAEDVLSCAKLRAFEKIHSHSEHIINFKAWITRICKNVSIDFYRKNKKEVVGFEHGDGFFYDVSQKRKEIHSSPEDLCIRNETTILVENIVQKMPPSLKEAFILRLVYKKSYSDIARKLNLRQENVRKRFQQAKDMIKNFLISNHEACDIDALEDLLKTFQETAEVTQNLYRLTLPLGRPDQQET